MSEVHAQVRLENYLKEKYINFKKLIVKECKEDFMGMSDIFSQFGDIFGGNSKNFWGVNNATNYFWKYWRG